MHRKHTQSHNRNKSNNVADMNTHTNMNMKMACYFTGNMRAAAAARSD